MHKTIINRNAILEIASELRGKTTPEKIDAVKRYAYFPDYIITPKDLKFLISKVNLVPSDIYEVSIMKNIAENMRDSFDEKLNDKALIFSYVEYVNDENEEPKSASTQIGFVAGNMENLVLNLYLIGNKHRLMRTVIGTASDVLKHPNPEGIIHKSSKN